MKPSCNLSEVFAVAINTCQFWFSSTCLLLACARVAAPPALFFKRLRLIFRNEFCGKCRACQPASQSTYSPDADGGRAKKDAWWTHTRTCAARSAIQRASEAFVIVSWKTAKPSRREMGGREETLAYCVFFPCLPQAGGKTGRPVGRAVGQSKEDTFKITLSSYQKEYAENLIIGTDFTHARGRRNSCVIEYFCHRQEVGRERSCVTLRC